MPHSAVASYSFQPTLPLRGATTSCSTAQCGSCFNPRSPCGERRCSPSPPRGTARFNPRSPCGERRATEKKRENLGSFQPTLPLRGATTPAPPSPEARVFQPTLPLRGATATGAPARRWSSSFNPRSPCGERRWRDLHQALLQRVSTHAPLAGSDGYSCSRPRLSSLFQPTLPLRGATGHGRRRHQEADVSTHAPLAGSDGPHLELLNVVLVVSTHAPLAGSDPRTFRCRSRQACFNPRSPCGERLFGFLLLVCLDEFQPTLPLRGATPWRWHRKSSARVSTHAPLAGSDASTRARSGAVRCFNPRSPCGERRIHSEPLIDKWLVSTHAPLAGSDSVRRQEMSRKKVSTHAPLAGSDYLRWGLFAQRSKFQPTLPLRGATALDVFRSQFAVFQPTLPLRGATQARVLHRCRRWVSTHAPLAGSDHLYGLQGHRESVSTHAPLAGSDPPTLSINSTMTSFNPRSPCGERLLHLVNVALRAYHMHDVFHPNASSDELRPSEANQKAVRTSQGIPDSPQFAPPIIPTAYS